jgi:hypothetical protein
MWGKRMPYPWLDGRQSCRTRDGWCITFRCGNPFKNGTKPEMSFRKHKQPSQTPLPLVGSTFESVLLQPYVSLSFRNQSNPLEPKAVLVLLFHVSMRASRESMTQPVAVWTGDQASVDVLEPLIGEVVQEAIAYRQGHLEIKFYNERTLIFEPEADGEWRFHRLDRNKPVLSITWSDVGYV